MRLPSYLFIELSYSQRAFQAIGIRRVRVQPGRVKPALVWCHLPDKQS